jgi:hypothetical protein
MEAFDIIDELNSLYKSGLSHRNQDQHLTETDVARWSSSEARPRSQVFEEIARFLAYGFNSSELSFEFCAAIVNDLFGPYVDTPRPKSKLFWDVYLAFDEGEYYHGNNRDEDPIEKYTRPMIAVIVEALEASALKAT